MPIITHSPNFPFIAAPYGWESSRFRSACGFSTMRPVRKSSFPVHGEAFSRIPAFSPLIPSDTLFFRTDPFNLRHASWKNPWDATRISTESFFDLYEKAVRASLPWYESFTHYCIQNQKVSLQEHLTLEFLKEYGNLSFHSGLDARIPS